MRDRLEHAARLLRDRDLEGARRELDALIESAPNEPVAHNLLGLVRLESREYPAAIESFSTAIRLRVPYPEALINLSVACNRTGEHELAKQVSEMALAAAPGSPPALLNLGMAFKGMRRLSEAKRAFELAGPHPMAQFNLGHTLLLEGDLDRGLPLYEARREVLRTGAGLRGRPWHGEPRPKERLLLLPEQGLGDFILMTRFFVPLLEQFARVVVLSPEPLARLVATLDPRLEVVTSADAARYDVWAPVMSLPYLLGIRCVKDVPTEPWLLAGHVREPRVRPRVGINWAGNPAYAYDAVRSTSLESFAPLLGLAEFDWVSLHRGVRESEAEAFGLPQPLRDAADFLDTAGVIAELDLVISTETAIPNLSAAMGVPTCVLSVRDVDWRWGSWYRGVTVCAQHAPGNWFGPIAAAAEALGSLLLSFAEREAA